MVYHAGNTSSLAGNKTGVTPAGAPPHLSSCECVDSLLLPELCGERHYSLGIIAPRATPSHTALFSAVFLVMGLR